MNFTHSSRKSWALIRRLGAAQQPPKSTHLSVSANAIAAYLIQAAKALHDKKFEWQVCMQGRTLLQQIADKTYNIDTFITELSVVENAVQLVDEIVHVITATSTSYSHMFVGVAATSLQPAQDHFKY